MDRLQLTLLSALFGCLLFRLSSTQGPSRGVCLTGNIDLVFILDASSSVTERNFRLASRFIEMTLRNAEIDDGTVRVGLIVYSSNTHIHFSLGQHSSRNAMIRDLRKAKTIPGSSNTADALLALRTKVFGTNEDRADARNIAILITADSSSGISDAATTQEATQSKQDGVEIYAIGVGLTDPSLLDAIASEPLSSYSHIIDGYRNLEDLRPVLFKTKCVDAAPDIASEIVTQLPDAFQNGCGSNPMDLVFLVDTSLGSRYQRQIRQFLQDLVEYADIESGNVRISFATFNSIPQIIFRLNELNNKYEIKRAIRDAPSNSGNRNTADALDLVRQQILHTSYGNRPGVPDVLLVITTGRSRQSIERAADTLKAQNVNVFAVGLDLHDHTEIERISSEPIDEHTFVLPTVSDLDDMKDLVFAQICTQGGTIRETSSSIADSEELDLVYLLHFSNEMSHDDFNRIISFIKGTVENTDVDSGGLRVGAALYRKSANVLFHLNQYATKEDLLRGISGITFGYRSSSASAAEGLDVVRKRILNRSGGDRPATPNGVIVLTDSNSDDTRETARAARELHEAGVDVLSIGVGVRDPRELSAMASKQEYAFALNDASELDGLRDTIKHSVRALQDKTPAGRIEPITVRQPAPLASSSQADIVVALHISQQASLHDFQLVLQYLQDVLSQSGVDSGRARVGLLVYGRDSQIIFRLDQFTSVQDIQRAILGLSPSLRSHEVDASKALSLARQMFEDGYEHSRQGVPKALIFVTDAESNFDSESILSQRDLARGEGIHTFGIGVGRQTTEELQLLSWTFDNMVTVPDYSGLRRSTNDIRRKIYALRSSRDDRRPIEFPGLFTPSPETQGCALSLVDLVFVLDTSTSVSEYNFQKMITFMKNLLDKADIDNGNVRVGALTYSTQFHIQFYLSNYTSKADLFAAIDRIPYIYGSTNTADGLLTMRTDMFEASRGNRDGVPNVAILITDGLSNINAQRTVPEAIRAREGEHNIHIYVIGIGLSDTREIDQIATPPASENSFTVQTFDELQGLDEKIFSSVCPETVEVVPPVIPLPPPTSRCGLAEVDLVIILDSSTSVGQENFQKMLLFCKELLMNADIDSGNVRVGIVLYSSEVNVQFQLSRYSSRAAMFDRIDNIEYIPGNTNTAGGIRTMRQEMFTRANGDRPNVRNVAIVMTDGVSNINSHSTLTEAETARLDGIHIYAIGIGLTDTRELNGIASLPASQNSFSVQSFDDLHGVDEKIFQGICPVELRPRTPRPTPPPIEPTHVITLPPRPSGCDQAQVDLVIVLDSSTSVGRDNFQKMLRFCKNLLENADIDSGNVRVGLLIYSTEVHVQFYLEDYTSKADVFNAIDNIDYVYGSTNTADGILRMSTELFSSQYGDRPNVPNIGIVITDGVSNINAHRTISEAQNAKAERIHIFAIGIGLTDTTELDAIASYPASENSFNVEGFDALHEVEHRVFHAICPEPPVTGFIRFVQRPESVRVQMGRTARLVCTAEGRPKPDITWEKDSSRNFPAVRDGRLRISADGSFEITDVRPEDEGTYRCIAKNTVDNIFAEASLSIPEYIRFVRTPEAVRVNRGETARLTCVAEGHPRPDITWEKDSSRNFPALRDGRLTVSNDGSFIIRNVQPNDQGIYRCIAKNTADTIFTEAPISIIENIRFVRTPEAVRVNRGETARLTCVAEGQPKPDITWEKDSSRNFPALRDGRLTVSNDGSFIIRNVQPDDQGIYRCIAKNTADTIFAEAPINIIEYIRFRTTPRDVRVTEGESARLTCIAEGHPKPDVTWEKDSRRNFPAVRDGRLTVSDDGSFIIRDVKPEDQGNYKCIAKNTADTISSEAALNVITRPRLHGYDVVLILDSSVPPLVFDWILDFARGFIQTLSIDDGEFRVGLLVYSTNSHPEFHLNEYKTKAEVLNGIDLIPYRAGQTNTAQAFQTVHRQMFKPNHGDRDFARNYIVLVTGNEESMNTLKTQTAVDQVKRDGTAVFVVGLDIRNTQEVDDIASKPKRSYQFLVRGRDDLMEVPKTLTPRIRRLPPPQIPDPRTTPRPTRPTRRPITTPTPRVTRRPIPERTSTECTSTGDVVFILDTSGSVGDEYFHSVLNFTYSTVDGLDIDSGHYRVGVITFSGASRNEFFLNSYSTKADIEQAIQGIDYVYGFTHTAAALRSARLEQFTSRGGDRRDVPNVVVIITDGQSNIMHYQTIPEAMRLKRMGVTIITIAVGFTDQTSELVGLTSPPVADNLIYVDNYEALEKLTEQLVAPLCTDTNLCSERNPCQNGGSCIDGLRSYMCLCPNQFFGEHCEKRCGEAADVVFVLDSSSGVGTENFGRMKTYAEHLIREMNMEACNIHVGVMKYSSAPMIQFGLGAYQDTETITRAVDSIHYTRGMANMGSALRTLRTQMFNGAGGDRRGVRNIAYLLTDGSNQVHPEATLSEAELAIGAGIRIMPIGVSLREREEVESIALSQGVSTIEIADEPQLLMMSDQVLSPLFDREDRCAINPCEHGGSCVNEVFRYRCVCVSGYSGDNCGKRCTSRGDVVFAVDTSRYMTRKELRRVRRFIRSIVKRMQFHSTSFKVGLVDFSRNSIVHLDFSAGTTKRAVLAAMSTLRSRAGDPLPAEAMRKARIRIFGGRGGEQDRPDYLILITKSMRGQKDIFQEANKLKTGGAKIIGVGIGMTNSDKDYMTAAVSSPLRSSLYLANDVTELKKISDQIMEHMCDDHDVCAENPCQNGGTCVSNHGTFYCQCPKHYAGARCERGCDAVADVVFLIDSSGSVGHHDFRKVKDFVHNMVEHLSIGKDNTRVSVATFSTRSSIAFYLSDFYTKDAVQNAVSGVSYEYGNTNLAGGLKLVRHRILSRVHGDRAEVQNFLVVVTDGLSNINPENTIPEANLLKKHGTHIYSIGVGAFDPWELQAIASKPSSANSFVIKDYNALDSISEDLIRATCRDISICDGSPCANGGTCVPGINMFTCQCQKGFKGKLCERECTAKKDVVFLVDSSGSVGVANFQSSLKFLSNLVEEMTVEGVSNEFGFVTFNSDVRLVFSLGRYKDVETVINAIETSRYSPGATNTAGALRTAIELYGPHYGDRSDAENIVILITDGLSNVKEYDTIPAARELRRMAQIIVVGVGVTNTTEIENIASSPDDIYKVDSYLSLDDLKTNILGSLCDDEDS